MARISKDDADDITELFPFLLSKNCQESVRMKNYMLKRERVAEF